MVFVFVERKQLIGAGGGHITLILEEYERKKTDRWQEPENLTSK